MVQRTVLKLDFSCPKCKKKLLKSVSGLQGIDKIELDAAKSTVTVTGNVDPYEVIIRARKTIKYVEVLTIGPPPPPPKPVDTTTGGGGGQKKPEEKSTTADNHIHTPHPHPHPQPCHVCEQMMYRYRFVGQYSNEPDIACSIL